MTRRHLVIVKPKGNLDAVKALLDRLWTGDNTAGAYHGRDEKSARFAERAADQIALPDLSDEDAYSAKRHRPDAEWTRALAALREDVEHDVIVILFVSIGTANGLVTRLGCTVASLARQGVIYLVSDDGGQTWREEEEDH